MTMPAALVDNNKLKVDLGTDNDVIVSGTIIAELSATDNAVLDNIDTSLNNIEAGIAAEDSALGSGILIQGDDGTDRKNVLVDTDGHVQVDVLSVPSTIVTATDLDIRNLTNTDIITAELSSIDNAVLDVIAADTTSLDGKVTTCNTGAVVISSGNITETNSGDIKTAIEILDNAISGNEMQVDVVAEIPAGTQIIGKTGIDQTTPGTTNNVSVTTVKPDGTNTMPSLDSVGRAGFSKITDGVETALISTGGLLQVSTPVSALVLTNDPALTEDTQMDGMYRNTSAGTGPHYFTIPTNSTNSVEIVDILFATDTAVTLSIELQALAQGAANWQPIPAYTTGEYAADGASQKLNSAFPLRHVIHPGNQYRVKATVGGSTKVGVQVMAAIL